MKSELIVPMLVSVGLMALMLRALVFRQPKLQSAHATRTLHRSYAAQPESRFVIADCSQSPSLMDQESVGFIADLCRSLARYQDCRVALADNYLSRACDETQSIWEFTNYWYGFKAAFDFDLHHPTSLIYRRDSHGQYTLIGAAFTAPERFSAEQRVERLPAHIAEWQPHGMFGWVARVYFRTEDIQEERGTAA